MRARTCSSPAFQRNEIALTTPRGSEGGKGVEALAEYGIMGVGSLSRRGYVAYASSVMPGPEFNENTRISARQ